MSDLLDERQMRALRAAVDCAIPPDDFPGGAEAGVCDYILGQLRRDLAHLAEDYPRFLDALNAEAQAAHEMDFDGLELAQQEALFAAIERDATRADWPLDAAAFLSTFCEHCGEGFYSDPGNGGNRDSIAWHMIGFEARA